MSGMSKAHARQGAKKTRSGINALQQLRTLCANPSPVDEVV